MTPERWKQVEQLCQDALELKPEDRPAFLSRQVDEELRLEVESLLNFQGPGDKLLEVADPEEISLQPGARLGPYEVTGTLGSGGMGEVYEASDTRLGRQVAIKVSTRRFGERFEIEAKAIAAINHPNVCTLFDVGPNFLVMELIKGETLAKRLQRGLLSPIEVAKRGAEIAHGIAAAHARGIVHRDLKPGNIMLTSAGVKVLDLGVAKFEPDGAHGELAASAGEIILGTRVYMAPEQVAGLKCDARSDIYSLGLILSEMLTGKRALDKSEKAPNSESAALQRVIRKCLASDPEERWQSAEDMATNLEWAAQGSTPPMTLARRLSLAGFAALVLLGGVLWARHLLRPAPQPLEADFVIDPPQGTRIAARIPTKALIAVSPDGEKLVIVAQDEGGKRALYLRALKSDDYRRLAQTDGASLAFWSPDSQWIGFFAKGHLKKIPSIGGPVQTITDVTIGDGEGAAWSPDGTVVFAQPRVGPAALPKGPLYSVAAAGGTASPATTLDSEHGEQSHSWPQFLPDGKRFQYLSRNQDPNLSRIYVQELGGKTRSVLMPSRMQVVSAQGPNGRQYLLFPHDRALFAQPWNPKTLELFVEGVAIADDVRYNPIYGTSGYSVSENGVLAYRAGLVSTSVTPTRQMVWYSRTGERLGTVGEPGNYSSLALSPDEKKVAVDRIEQNSADGWDVWILDIGSGVFSRLTRGPVFREPSWSPDSNRIAAVSLSPQGSVLVDIPLTSSDPEPVVSRPGSLAIPVWSGDGHSILFSSGVHAEQYDLGSKKSRSVLAEAVSPRNISISPNGQWVAWQSEDTSRAEVFVARYPSWRQIRQVSSAGGGQPAWRRDSKELFYLAANSKIMAVQLGVGPGLNPSKPIALFQSPTEGNPRLRQYAVASGGARFLVMENVGSGVEAGTERYHIKLNWYARLQTPKSGMLPASPQTR